MDNFNVLPKIDNIEGLTKSQKDKFEMQKIVQENLINFLNNQIEKINSKSELKDTVIQVLKNKVTSEDSDDRMTVNQLLQLLSILSKDENDAISNILNVIKEKQSTIINIPPAQEGINRDSSFTQEDILKTKKLINMFDFVDKLKESEMSLEELETRKKD